MNPGISRDYDWCRMISRLIGMGISSHISTAAYRYYLMWVPAELAATSALATFDTCYSICVLVGSGVDRSLGASARPATDIIINLDECPYSPILLLTSIDMN